MMWRAIFIDDEEYVRSYLISLFPWSQFGFEMPLEAENVAQAISFIESVHPDVIFTDIRMPEKDGLELTAWVRRNVPDIPVIILSAYNDFSYVREALRLGAKDYLIKAEISSEIASRSLQQLSELLRGRDFTKLGELSVSNFFEQYRKQAVTSFWRDVLEEIIDEEQLTVRASKLNLSLTDIYFTLMLIVSTTGIQTLGFSRKL